MGAPSPVEALLGHGWDLRVVDRPEGAHDAPDRWVRPSGPPTGRPRATAAAPPEARALAGRCDRPAARPGSLPRKPAPGRYLADERLRLACRSTAPRPAPLSLPAWTLVAYAPAAPGTSVL